MVLNLLADERLTVTLRSRRRRQRELSIVRSLIIKSSVRTVGCFGW